MVTNTGRQISFPFGGKKRGRDRVCDEGGGKDARRKEEDTRNFSIGSETFGPRMASLYDTRLHLLRFSVLPSKEKAPILRILYERRGAIRLFSFLSLSLSLLARRASPVITKLAFNGRATVVVVRRPHLYFGTPEKNVGCMPVGLCHFRRGLSLSFSALFYSALAPPSARTLFFSAVARHRQ